MDLDLSNVSDDSQKILLNKSASFSGSPIVEKYEIKQLFKNKDGDTYIRHYSYEIPDRRKPHIQQIQQLYKFTKPSKKKEKPIRHSIDYNFTPYEGGISKNFPGVKFGTPFKHLFNFAKHVPEEQGFEKFLTNNKDDCTPMDVDTSINSNTSLNKTLKDVKEKSMIDVHYQDRENNEIEHRNKVPKLLVKPSKPADIFKVKIQKENMFLFRILKIFFVIFLPVTLGVICMFFNSDYGYVQSFDSTNMVKDLHKLLYGQDKVIEDLEYNLNLFKNQKIFLFTGGNGVGKTYTAQIIKKNYPHKNNIQKFVFNVNKAFDMEKEILANLKTNEHNLIIVDGLVMNDVYMILPILNGLCATGNKFIVIVIFNLQEISDDLVPISNLKIKGEEISKIFDNNNIIHSTFMYDLLNAEDTKECIRYNIKLRRLKINEDVVEEVLENVNYKNSGCKGVYAKVSLVQNKLEAL